MHHIYELLCNASFKLIQYEVTLIVLLIKGCQFAE
jgi:hypothetical protein